jgi:hypothetical protein
MNTSGETGSTERFKVPGFRFKVKCKPENETILNLES